LFPWFELNLSLLYPPKPFLSAAAFSGEGGKAAAGGKPLLNRLLLFIALNDF